MLLVTTRARSLRPLLCVSVCGSSAQKSVSPATCGRSTTRLPGWLPPQGPCGAAGSLGVPGVLEGCWGCYNGRVPRGQFMVPKWARQPPRYPPWHPWIFAPHTPLSLNSHPSSLNWPIKGRGVRIKGQGCVGGEDPGVPRGVPRGLPSPLGYHELPSGYPPIIAPPAPLQHPWHPQRAGGPAGALWRQPPRKPGRGTTAGSR